jgi:hypothetical protein
MILDKLSADAGREWAICAVLGRGKGEAATCREAARIRKVSWYG